MRVRWMVVLVVAGVLAAPAVAGAGGWATVQLSSTPDGLRAGQPWDVELTVLQHGRTPLDDLSPSVAITSADGATTRTVAATPTGRPGVYRASVAFPHGGRWSYVVDDGFTQRHSYPPVEVGGPAAAAGGGGGPDVRLAVITGLAAALLAAGLTVLVRRVPLRRGAAPARS